MKKIIALVLMLVLCLTTLTSCMYLESAALGGLLWLWTKSESEIVARNVFFDDDLIVESRLTDMPLPNLEGSALTNSTLYLNMTDEEFDAYAKQVFDYLWAKEDAYFKGYWVESGCPGGIFFLFEDIYAPLTEDYNLESDSHEFVFSTTEFLNEGDEYNRNYWNEVVIRIVRASGTLGKEDFTYNTVIEIKNKDNNARGSVYYENYHEEYQ